MSDIRIVLALLLAPLVAFAADQKGLVAVLPVGTSAGIQAVERETFEESIRTSAGDHLTPRGYTVLAGETTMQLLADNGVDAAKACEASCALQAARELRAKLFVSGSLAKLEGVFVAFVRLFDTETGKQLGSVRLEDASVRGLVKTFDEKAKDLFGKIDGGAAPAPVPAPAPAPAPTTHVAKPFAVRAGLGALNGVAGVGFSYRLSDRIALALGTGLYIAAAGVSIDPFAWDGPGGLYLDAALVAVVPNPAFGFVAPETGVGVALSVGWDLRIAELVSLKLGVGPAVNSVTAGDVRSKYLTVDGSVGVVF